jgi:DNA primase
VTFLDLLAEHGLDPEETSGGREIALRCPLCDDVKPRLYVNAALGLFICFRCEERGSGYDLLTTVLELDHFQAMRKLDKIKAERNGHLHPPPTQPQRSSPVGIVMPADVYHLTTPEKRTELPFWNYLEHRGVNRAQVLAYQMGYAITGSFAWRVIIPIYTEGVLRTVVARTIGNVEPKTRHPAGAQPSRALFNIDVIDSKSVIMVEGVFDALRLLQLSGNVVATLGTNLSAHQRQLLREHGVQEVFLMWDGDPPGRANAARVAAELQAAMFHVKHCSLPEGVDPGSASWDTMTDAVLSATEAEPTYISTKLARDRLDARIPEEL